MEVAAWRRPHLLVLAAACGLAACSVTAASRQNSAAPQETMAQLSGEQPVGGLHVIVGDVVTDGRNASIRGTVENRYDQPVDGIRYVVEIIQPGQGGRVLDTWRHEVTTSLDPGQRRRVTLDVSSMYFGSDGSVFNVSAFPVKIGGREVAMPAADR